ncbi:proline-specific peptidase [Annulohypoxylon bovei var. microspora]|nr:proline-specific peptidase [Annulohypoxylon bovei var. microspora]
MTEGIATYNVPGISAPCQTWYNVIGDLNGSTSTPLVILHGGPGAAHDYLLPLTDLAPEVPLIFYDQIGSGRSTHLPDRASDEDFWQVDLFENELDNLLVHLGLQERPVDVYGHSWGGVLAASWASKPSPSTKNLRRLVLASSPASMSGFAADLAVLRKQLPKDVQAVLDTGDETQNYTSPEYLDAIDVFYQQHLSLTRPWPPQEVQDMQKWLAEDMSSYLLMYGPNPLVIAGTLSNWTVIPSLHQIKVPTLLIDGAEDTIQEESVKPLFEHIEKAKLVTLDNAAHFAHVDQREKYMQHLRAFLVN